MYYGITLIVTCLYTEVQSYGGLPEGTNTTSTDMQATCSPNASMTECTTPPGVYSSCQSDSEMKSIYILSLLPYPDPEGREALQPSWDEGQTLYLSEQLAVESINKNDSILCGYTVKLLQGDSGCDIRSKANQAFFHNVLYSESAKRPLGIIGPGCSNSALTVSALSGRRELSILTIHIAGSLLLTNRSLYNYSFGTLDSTEVFVQASLALIRRNNWKPVGVLYDESRLYYASTVRRFEEELRSANLSFISSAVYNTFLPLDVLVQDRIRVIFLFVGPDFLSRILCLAYHLDILYPIYQFVIVSRVTDEIQPLSFKYMDKTVTCTESDITRVINGSLIIHYQLKSNENMTDIGVSYEQFLKNYEQRVSEYNTNALSKNQTDRLIKTSFWAASFFDAVWSMALALNSSVDTNDESDVINSIDRWYGSELANTLKENLMEQDFRGLSGRIRYNHSSGYVIRNVNVYQIDSSRQMNLIAYYSKLNDSIVLTSTNGKFINGTFRMESTIVAVSLTIGGIVLSITVVSFIVTLILHILIVIYRDQKSVKASSRKLSHIAFIGCYVLAFGGLINFIVECLSGIISPSLECHLFHVLNAASAIGVTLIFGPIGARTWRLYRIYVHYKNPGRFISDWFLLSVILILSILNLIVAILPSVIEPFRLQYTNDSYFHEVLNSEGSTQEIVLVEKVIIECVQDGYFLWFGFSYFFPISLMVFAFWLAVFTRNIPHKDFQTQSIMLLVYLLSGFLIVGLVLYFVFADINTLQFVVLSTIFTLFVLFSCLLLFLPPLYPILKQNQSLNNICFKVKYYCINTGT